MAQEIEWKKLSLGFSVQNYKTDSDLNEYWKNSLGAGISGRYELKSRTYLEGNIYLSKFSSKIEDYPDFYFLGMFAGIGYKFITTNHFNTAISAGLSNSTFLFSGEEAERIEENDTESEFGVFAGLDVSYIYNKFEISIFYRIQNVFSSPVELVIQNIGIKILLREVF